MVKTALIIQSVDANGNSYEKLLSNVNPALTDANADVVARSLNGLSTHTYVDAIRRDEKSINEALEEAEQDG